MAIGAGLCFAAITVHVKMADKLGAPISSAKLHWSRASNCWHAKLFFMYGPIFSRTIGSTSSLCVMDNSSRFTLNITTGQGKGSVWYLNRPYIKAWQFESNMWVWKVLIAFLSRFHPTPCQCQNPAEFALQDVLLRWKPAVSCSSTGSRFRCFGSVASKSRGTHIFRRIRVA